MNQNWRTFVFIAVLLVIILFFMTPEAGAAVTVEPISEAALDKLLNANNNKVMVAFMAAWCGPCIEELPTLNKLYKKYSAQGLKLIGVSIDLEGPRAMQPVIDKLQISFPVYWYGESAVERFSLFVIPMIYFVKDGRIVEKLPGRKSERVLKKKIRQFLSQ